MDRIMRGRGWLPDAPEVVAARRPAAERFGAAPVPRSASLRMFAPPVLDQLGSSGCVGHAFAAAIATSLAAAGHALAWTPSAAQIYQLARCVDRGLERANQPLYDLGTRIGAACSAITTWGIVPGRVPVDVDMSQINREPTLDELERAALRLIVGEYGIPSGPGAADLARRAIAAGHPVVGGVLVGKRAESWRAGDAPLTAVDAVGDGHAMCILAYDGDTFRARSSWGQFFGDAGDMIGDASWLAEWHDIVVMDVRLETAR